jgi:hypothetical protein
MIKKTYKNKNKNINDIDDKDNIDDIDDIDDKDDIDDIDDINDKDNIDDKDDKDDIDKIYKLIYNKDLRNDYFNKREEDIKNNKVLEETKYNKYIDKVYNDTKYDNINMYYFENANKLKSLFRFDIINYKIYNNILSKDEISNTKINVFNIKLFELLNNNKCKDCNNNFKFIKKMGHCAQHINNFNSKETHYDALKQISVLTPNEMDELKISLYNIYNNMILLLDKYVNEQQIISVKYNNFNSTLTKFKIKFIIQNNLYINDANEILYTNLIDYYNNISSKIKINYNFDLSQNNFNLTKEIIKNGFKIKQLNSELKILSKLKNYNTICKFKCDNSEYIFEKIMCNLNVNTWTYSAQFEKILYIDNQYYRADLYMIIKTKNNNFIDLIIETDENHHFDNITKKRDYNKDIFAIKQGIAIIRIDLSESKIITNDIINLIIKYITNIHYTNNPVYYFSEKYINFHTQIKDSKEIKKGITITLPQHLKDSLKEPLELIKSQYSKNSNQSIITPDKISFGSSNKTPKKKLKESNSMNTDDSSNTNIIISQKITIGSNKKKITKNKQL